MAPTRKLVVEILGDAKGFGGAIGEVNSKLGSFASSVGKMALGAGVALGGLAAATVPLIGAASDLAETQSKVGVIFGAASKDIEKFADTAAKSLGQSKQQAMNAAATFATFGKGAGLAGKPLATFATDMTALASDLASFNNTSPEEAIEAIGAALRGEAEPIRKYGVLLDDATLRNEALRLGLIKTTKEALTPANKVLAAQAAIMKQTTDAQGDFARTSDGLANKQRILAAQLDNLKATIGTALLPVALKLVDVFSAKVMPAFEAAGRGITMAFEAFSEFRKAGEWESHSTFERIGVAAAQAFGWISENVPPILERLQEVATRVFGWLAENVPPVLQAIGRFIADDVMPQIQRFSNWTEEHLLPALRTLWAEIEANVLPKMRDFAVFLRDEVWPILDKYVIPAIGKLTVFLLEDLIPALIKTNKFFEDNIYGPMAKFSEFINDLPGNISKAWSGLSETLTAPFREAFRGIAMIWNSTVGKLSFETPDWVPGIGGKGWSMPKITGFHSGGTFRAPTPGGVGLALLRDGEEVSTPGQGGATMQPIIVEVGGEPILNALLKLDRRNGGTPLRVRAV